jgi:phage shock protein A
MRKAVLPMVKREAWTDAEYRDYRRKLDTHGEAVSGSLTWQAHSELQRMTDGASRLAASLITWKEQVATLDADAARLQGRAAAVLASGDEGQAKQLLADRRAVLGRRASLKDDIDRSEATLDSYRREISALEGRLSDDLRRESLAKARIEGARDTIRARQLMYGTLAEAAMARREAREREATLAEAEVEALGMGSRDTLAGELENLEIERDLDGLRAQGPRPV